MRFSKVKSIFIFGVLLVLALCITGCEKNPVPDSTGGGNIGTGQGQTMLVVTNPPSEAKPSPTPFATPAPAAHVEKEVVFSVGENFIMDTVNLELTAEQATGIYYTLDGTIPDENSTEYTGPIEIKATSVLEIYPYTARAKYADGTWSKTCVRTYFAALQADKRFDCPVFCITTDPYNLYDYEYGILVSGKIMDDFLSDNPDAVVDGHTPANYNQLRGRESERDIFLEVFNQDGSLMLEQDAGIRCYGGWSRSNAMKSMKLFARKEYDEVNNKFRYPFFTTAIDENGNLIDAFKRLVLRAYGNDYNQAFIREELFQTLAKQAGYEAKSVRPCAVYVNGEYKGCYFLSEVWHDSYFETHYGKYTGTIEILEGTEHIKTGEDDGSNQYAVDEFNTLYDTYAYADLTDDALFNELCEKMDIVNYLEYYAYQTYLSNKDWPHNNYKVYRYYAAEGEEYGEGAPFDGKWRCLLHDMDFSTGVYGENPLERYLSVFTGKMDPENQDIYDPDQDVSPLFTKLIKRKDCREIFVKKTLDLINGVFRQDYFEEQLDIIHQSRLKELGNTYGTEYVAEWVNDGQISYKLKELRDFIKKRDGYAYLDMYNFFNLSGTKYKMELEVPEGSKVTVNSFTTDRGFTGSYYSDYNTVLNAEFYGKTFSHWIVNGVEHTEKELVISDSLLEGKSKITVTPVFQ